MSTHLGAALQMLSTGFIFSLLLMFWHCHGPGIWKRCSDIIVHSISYIKESLAQWNPVFRVQNCCTKYFAQTLSTLLAGRDNRTVDMAKLELHQSSEPCFRDAYLVSNKIDIVAGLLLFQHNQQMLTATCQRSPISKRRKRSLNPILMAVRSTRATRSAKYLTDRC